MPTTPGRRSAALLAIVLIGSGCATTGPANRGVTSPKPATPTDSGPAMRRAYFYANRPYGTEAQFNPLTAILSNGFDQLRTGSYRPVFELNYRAGATGAWHSIIHADRVVREYGVRDWLRYEVFPLSTKGGGGGQWVPNYQLHLFAGGATYIRLIAWYEQHGIAHSRWAAASTFYAAHFLNEMIENTAQTRGSADAMTDLVIFDPAAILLWNSDRVQRLVGRRVEFTEWPGQTTLGIPGNTVENTFQTTMLRVRLPGTQNWRAFTTMGGSYVGGVSRRSSDSTWVSLGFGADAATNPVVDTVTGRKTVQLLGNIGVFVDRSGSLLGSIVLKSGFDAGATLNVYPGVLRLGAISPGLWAQLLRGGGVRAGVVSRWGVGVGRNP